jgi:predicted Zn-dependent protease
MCMRCAEISRRSLLVGGGAVAASMATGIAQARVRPADMVPLIGPGFKPTDEDEKGIWQLMDRAEEEISGSNLLVKDPELISYLQGIIGTVGGPAAKDMRIYLAHVPDFNAMMFPTGFSVIFTGLLLRMRSEAQLAGVIAHESGHFLRRHMIRSWRDQRKKTDLFAIGAMAAGVGGAAGGVYLGDYVQLAQLGTILSLFSYSRAMEAEADAMGARLIAEAGYPPIEMANVWDQLIGEEDASARYRRKHRRRGTLFDTHPSPTSRMADLKLSAAEVTVPGRAYDSGRARYLSKIASIRPMLLDD